MHIARFTVAHPPLLRKNSAFSHLAVRIPGKEGILPDTGAVFNLSGPDFIRRMELLAARHGMKVRWQKLKQPKSVGGVGDSARACTHQAIVPGFTSAGRRIDYITPVIGGGSGGVPGLWGLNDMAARNTYFGTASGRLAMIPEGTDHLIQWPIGTSFTDMERAPSGDWLVIISHFEQAQQESQQMFPAVHLDGEAAQAKL